MGFLPSRLLRRAPKRWDRPAVLFLTSPAPAKYAHGFYLGEKRFPLGIGYLVSVLVKNGVHVDFADLYARNRKVRFGDYDVVGIYADTICFEGGTIPLVRKIERSGFKGRIVMGGPHASVMPDSIPPDVHHIVQGEGEEVICGIVNGSIRERVIKSRRIRDLDSLPRPAYDIYRLSLYDLRFEELKAPRRVFTYSSSRGCPFDCRFCSSKSIYNRVWTSHSAERIVDDIRYLKDRFNIDGVYFREDNFSVDMDRVREMCSLLIEQGIRVLWKCETRVGVSHEDLALMYRAGLRIVYVGFESGSQHLLDIYNKQIDLNQSKQFVRDCKEIGLTVYGSFVVETPWETDEDVRLTREFVEELDLDRVTLNKYIAIPGSEMYEDIIRDPDLQKKKQTTVLRF